MSRRFQRRIDGRHVVELHMRKDKVLLVRDADIVEAEFFSNVGRSAHLVSG